MLLAFTKGEYSHAFSVALTKKDKEIKQSHEEIARNHEEIALLKQQILELSKKSDSN